MIVLFFFFFSFLGTLELTNKGRVLHHKNSDVIALVSHLLSDPKFDTLPVTCSYITLYNILFTGA